MSEMLPECEERFKHMTESCKLVRSDIRDLRGVIQNGLTGKVTKVHAWTLGLWLLIVTILIPALGFISAQTFMMRGEVSKIIERTQLENYTIVDVPKLRGW